MNHLQDLSVLVLGLGESGLAMARWCVRHGAQVRVWDSREAPPNAAALAEHVPAAERLSGELDADALDGIRLVLKSPGLAPQDARIAPLLAQAAERGVLVQGELDLFARALADLKTERAYVPKVLAITGTNGKTTTAAMTALLIERTGRRVALAGNIGPTMLQTLADALDAQAVLDADAALTAESSGDAGAALISRPTASAQATDGTEDIAAAQPDDEAQDLADAQAGDEAHSGDEAHAADETDDADADADADDTEATGEATGEVPVADDALVADDAPVARDVPAAGKPRAAGNTALPEVWVLELSSFQLDGAQGFTPSAAVVLNITQDHLDWHGTMPAYVAAKVRVYGSQTGNAVMVVPRDDAAIEAMIPAPVPVKGARGHAARTTSRRVVRFGLDAPRLPGDFGLVTENGMVWLVRALEAEDIERRSRPKPGEPAEDLHIQRLMPADALRIRGRHNAANALASLALATAIDCPLAPMLHGLREYAGEPHRVQFVATVGGVDAYDDSKGTNVGATVAALLGLGADKAPAKLVVILGGDGKGQDFSLLAEPVCRHARAVATIGRDADAIEAALAETGVTVQRHDSLEAATRWCFAQAQAADAVLLSPACASLDMFRNYAHRADVFVAAVHELAADLGGAAA